MSFEQNQANRYGGCLFAVGGASVNIYGAAAAAGCSAYWGGGLCLLQSSLRVAGNVTLSGNEAGSRGGGAYLTQGSLATVLVGGAVDALGNVCDGSGCEGGGAALDKGSTLTVSGAAAFAGGCRRRPHFRYRSDPLARPAHRQGRGRLNVRAAGPSFEAACTSLWTTPLCSCDMNAHRSRCTEDMRVYRRSPAGEGSRLVRAVRGPDSARAPAQNSKPVRAGGSAADITRYFSVPVSR